MSNGMVGADPDELDRVGLRLERAGNQMVARSRRISAALNTAPWRGHNADRFRQEFAGVHAKALADAARFLDDAYETLRRQADQQRRASQSGPRNPVDDLLGKLGRIIDWPLRFPWWPPISPFVPRRLPEFLQREWLTPMPMPLPWNPFGPRGIFGPRPHRPWPLLPVVPEPWLPRVPLPVYPIDWVHDVTVGLVGIGAPLARPGQV